MRANVKSLIIHDYYPTAKAIQRYLYFIYNIHSDITDFSPLIKNGTSSYTNYDLIITDVYDKNDINYGAQFGRSFEEREISIIYFFTNNWFKDDYNINHLPINSFYLPLQLESFLESLDNPIKDVKSGGLLEEILNTRPTTSSHH